MKRRLPLLSAAILSIIAAPHSYANDTELDTILVTGDFKQQNIQTISASASLFSANDINDRGAKAIDEILAGAANVNFTSGASRGRYIQIRGVGLRSQFVDPINPSVGLVIDGINYSGLGGSSLLFDIDQIEIYRGPQGTRFGADGMAGMIQMESAAPSFEPSLKVQLGAGNYNSREAGVATGFALTDDTAARISFYKNKSDGYMKNLYLDRDDTQGQDEIVSRFKIDSQLTDDFHSQLTVHYIDIDNGYDAFTLDNSRNSIADTPGKDKQRSTAVGIANTYSGFEWFDINLNVSGIDSDLVYSFDEDWVCNDSNKPELCAPGLDPDSYSSEDSYVRDRQDYSANMELTGKSANWVAGVYYQHRDTDLTRNYTYLPQQFFSNYTTKNIAAYGQVRTKIGPQTTLVTGLRVENYQGDYTDNNGFINDISDTMVGGKLGLEYQVIDRTMIYTTLTRGYKAGGINSEALAKAKDSGLSLDADFFKNHVSFNPEYLWSGEFGVKGSSLDNRFRLRLAAFYMYREDMQLKTWQLDGQKFTGYHDNASSGENYGLEIEGSYQFNENLLLTGSTGYLHSKINDFVTQSGLDQDGRAQAQAPKYQYAFTAHYNFTPELFATVGIEGKDKYYFSDSYNAKTPNSNLVNISLGYESDNWQLTAWARNVFDKDVPTRAFEFGNNPLDGYETHTYVQLGEPLVAGVTFIYQL